MTVVAVDTATDVLSVGLKTDAGALFEVAVQSGLRHSEYLMPAVEALVELAGVQPRFDLVVCMRGPGSFTGLRIGMATGKGLASGSGCPLVAVPTLDVLAGGLGYLSGTVVPVIDARKRRVYAALYAGGSKMSDDLDIAPADLVSLLEPDSEVLFTGPGAELLAASAAKHPRWHIDPNGSASRARRLLTLGETRYRDVGADPKDLGPVYLRESEAELGGRR